MATILIVDDGRVNREYLSLVLEPNGHRLLEASDGEEALTIIRRERPDLVISDILMPTMDGYELLHELRTDPALMNTRVLFYTAHYHEEEARSLARAWGVSDVLAKGCEPEMILQSVQVALTSGTQILGTPSANEDFDRAHQRLLTDMLARKVEKLRAANERLRESEEANAKYIGDLKRAAEHLRDAQLRLQHVISSSPAVLLTLAVVDGKQVQINWISDNLEAVFGHRPEVVFRREWWRENIHAEDFASVVAQFQADLLTQVRSTGEFRLRHSDGGYRWVRSDMRLIRNEAGLAVEIIGSWSDITERKQLEEQYRQAQKMEAVGRLAGGVAHDFNNLLTIIMGYSELCLGTLRPEDPLRVALKEIHRAGERATGLTRQLLAFSRKQVLMPVVLDLNTIIADMEKMLRRLIGEDVILTVLAGADLWKVKADPGQMEQVVMNIMVNARDAMPLGGKLLLETRNVEVDERYIQTRAEAKPGEHVLLAISDSGCGMDQSVKARIFEPFFTTKDPAKGTGLGLATVFGIIKQSGGHIEVYSEVGQGTSFKIYLPRDTSGGPIGSLSRIIAPVRGGRETILLVEDEEGVRRLAQAVLQDRGYTVLDAPHGGDALMICETRSQPIDLMITDVVMPHFSGRQLAERLATMQPTMKVLYMSGYTDDAIVHHGVLESGMEFLQKPFAPEALARKVREVLDNKTS